MPLDLQFGDLATRLRRGFGLRGRIPTQLDETVVPVHVVGSGAATPYADVPLIGWQGLDKSPSAGNVQSSGLRALPGSVVVVREIVYSQLTTGTALLMFRNADVVTAGFSTGFSAYSGNRTGHNPGAVQSVAFLAAAFAGVTNIAGIHAIANQALVLPFDWVLYPGDSLVIGPSLANIEFRGYMRCEIYPDAGSLTS